MESLLIMITDSNVGLKGYLFVRISVLVKYWKRNESKIHHLFGEQEFIVIKSRAGLFIKYITYKFVLS
jgi:hypothetical protein